MLLTIDVGNTNITLQLMQGEKTVACFRLTTQTQRTSDEFVMAFRDFFAIEDIHAAEVEDVVISSVVPKIMHALTNAVRQLIGKEPIMIAPGIRSGIEIRTENPREVGADRIVNVAAAYYTYHRSCIVVDFGTATTFDYISENGVFAYTVIAPGIGISAAALASCTARLPEIEICKPDSILGRNTVHGMQAGVVYGYIGLVEYIIQQMKIELDDPQAYVIATGGQGEVIAKAAKSIDVYDPQLAGKGMAIIYAKAKKR